MKLTLRPLLALLIGCAPTLNPAQAATPSAPVRVLAGSRSPFPIELRLRGQALTAAQREVLREAAERVSGLIASAYQPVSVDLPARSCDSALPALRERLTHFVVFVIVKDLGDDLYADAVPCELHDRTYLPVYALIDLNSRGLNDLPRADLLDTMIHELLHALGVGTLWQPEERVALSGDSDGQSFVRRSGRRLYYTGAKALAAYRQLGGQGVGIPLDPDGGHWNGGVFCSEIASGSAGDVTGRVNPVSSVTLAALEDLGYRVDRAGADRFRLAAEGCEGE